MSDLLLLVEGAGVGLADAKAVAGLPVGELLHVLQEVLGQFPGVLSAGVKSVSPTLEEGEGVVDHLVVFLAVEHRSDVGEVGGLGLGVQEELQSGDPQLVGVVMVGEDRQHEGDGLALDDHLPGGSIQGGGPQLGVIAVIGLAKDQGLGHFRHASIAHIVQGSEDQALLLAVAGGCKYTNGFNSHLYSLRY